MTSSYSTFLKAAPRLGANTSLGACRAEAETLRQLAETLFEASSYKAEFFSQWCRTIEAFSVSTLSESVASEAELERLAMDFRRIWLNVAHQVVVDELRSPPYDHQPLLPISQSHHFIYERVVGPDEIEQRLTNQVEIQGWLHDTCLFANGLAAIVATISVLRDLRQHYQHRDSQYLQLDMFGGYFETLRLMSLMNSSDLKCCAFQDLDIVLDRFSHGESDILFLEMIAYDFKQTVIDPAKLIQAVQERPGNRPWLLILDTTLLGPTFEIEPLLQAFGDRRPEVLIDIRSGLKLDQAGLELSNVGVVRFFTPEERTKDKPTVEHIHKALISIRKIMGSGLTYAQIAALDAPWIFHPEWMSRHSTAVLENNRYTAMALKDIGGIFSAVYHPALTKLSHLSWAESPLVVIELHQSQDTDANRTFLEAVIASEIKARKLVMYLGASFGFRHHRCEILVPEGPYHYDDGSPRGFLKIAMGARSGPTMEGLITLIKDIAAYADFEALRSDYANLRLADHPIRFPNIDALRTRN
ncbi:MAG: hypothetical protein JJ957_19055 [Pseudomonadales bacterium]|nr:hypothetical protein [Pseudomonadales bacterium]MBO6564136.1 hypothetical protein [Pseudomonadales bacterium]MBO6597594.1 hypothetical protein [Pseudomonadales bacterium]MBO6824356.1 hypothetical protein [Pseudomonadales bacterium]